MANTNAAFGLRLVSAVGDGVEGVLRPYFIPSTDTYEYNVGDIVSVVAGGDASGYSQVELFGGSTRGTTAGAGGGAITSGATRGVVVGFGTSAGTPQGATIVNLDPTNLNTTRIPATKAVNYYVYVSDSPSAIYEAQADTIATSAFNKNCPYFVSGMKALASPVAFSQSYAQGSAANTTATLPLRIVGGPHRVNNDFTSPGTYAKIYVVLNTHDLSSGSAGLAGV